MRGDQIQASVPAPVASLPPREPMSTVHFSMARSVHFSMAIDTPQRRGLAVNPADAAPRQRPHQAAPASAESGTRKGELHPSIRME